MAPWRTWSLLRHGLATAGIVDRKEFRRGGKGGSSYLIHYRYQALAEDKGHIIAEPEKFERRMYVAPGDYAEASENQRITVIYCPRKAKRSVIYEFAEDEAIRSEPKA